VNNREGVHALLREEIKRLEGDIEVMRSGKFRMQSYESGKWVDTTAASIASDERTIAILKKILGED